MLGALLTDLLTERVPAQEIDEDGPARIEMISATSAATRTRDLGREFRRDCLESHRAGALDEHDVPRLEYSG